MNIQSIFSELETASDFELFRLQLAISKALDDPSRIAAARALLRQGMRIEYFCEERNQAVLVDVLDIKRTRATVQEVETGKKWSLPFYCFNLDQVETQLQAAPKRGMSKVEISVSDTLGFMDSRDNQERIGTVIKLNPKTVVLQVGDTRWKVPYSLLFPVLSGEMGGSYLITGD
mgnify:CR=1 FL=1